MFGSDIDHSNLVAMEIYEADIQRDLSHDWIHERGLLVRIWLSPGQFADAITSLNIGTGTPATLQYVRGDDKASRDAPPRVNRREQFESEFQETMLGPVELIDELIAEAKTVTMKRKLEILKNKLMNNSPFVSEQFSRQMDRTVTEAKAEFEAFASARERAVGIRFLQDGQEETGGIPSLPAGGISIPEGG